MEWIYQTVEEEKYGIVEWLTEKKFPIERMMSLEKLILFERFEKQEK